MSKDGSGMKIAYILVVANLLISVVTYPMLPDRIIMHWGAGGVPDGYGSKLSGTLLMQLVQFFMLGIYVVIPRIDPQKKVTMSTGYYKDIMNLMLAYFMFFNVLFITQNLGYDYNMTSVMMPAIGVLLFFLGDILGKAEPNWFVGMRTPWTLSNDDVWRSTHEKAGFLFKVCGGISVAGVLFPVYSIWLLVGSITVTAFYLVVFSYTEFKRLEG
ncbi:DUF1648 domain-containing protein [Candidatus Bathyarchaeota archaeon]|nr:DUF1648 domain-containing protein [Candidatus Bathyarchaeota archaeon]MBT4424626.1 DUF1648 domain-containing protein [Candidatus Bathyarchaeota archaeon]MBT6604058.1 DUF1648 domain-containing protein [Candidatus Bathyarchaeota archaeon]MBT7187393.1 DUF1648 domain-containing protein [Candidatus Bathyarchaeota archaeon]MBT7345633.1 DUF1648 domain-containing protein [Candidatus Bathyarchaeota archaeon]